MWAMEWSPRFPHNPVKGVVFEIPFLDHPKSYFQKVASPRQINLNEGCPLIGSRDGDSCEVDTLDNVMSGCLESVSPPLYSVNSSSLIVIGDMFGLSGRIGFSSTDALMIKFSHFRKRQSCVFNNKHIEPVRFRSFAMVHSLIYKKDFSFKW